MNWIKKFSVVFFSFLPFSAGAGTILYAALAGVAAIAGFSIYRSNVPVNMADAIEYFSSCWSCQMFSNVMEAMSNMLPGVYHAIGGTVLPFALALTAIWFAWQILSGFFNASVKEPWSIASMFGTMLIKLTFVGALLVAPLPRLLTDIVIEPVLNIGLSLNRAVSGNQGFAKCVVATAIADPVSISEEAAGRGAFSPKMRHNLTCEIANVHKMTGLGMTIGWTMMNMAFDSDYMHHIMWKVPFFPNLPMLFVGLAILVLFFSALVPVPLYFLEVFIKLSMDLVMLPLMLLGWLFKDWKIFPDGSKTIRGIIEDFVKGTVSIALVGVFVSFAIMFLDAAFGSWEGLSTLQTALEQNDSKLLIDGLMLNNDSLIVVALMGVFITMFMISIPALVQTLFVNVKIPDNFYKTAKKDAEIVWNGAKKFYKSIKK